MEAESIQHDPEAKKFYIETEKGEAYLAYEEKEGVLDYYSTYVPDAMRGQGIAGRIVEEGLRYARENGYQVRPSCPYVAVYLKRHEEHQDLKA
jgi:predicted GNAT family acetyltransferase